MHPVPKLIIAFSQANPKAKSSELQHMHLPSCTATLHHQRWHSVFVFLCLRVFIGEQFCTFYCYCGPIQKQGEKLSTATDAVSLLILPHIRWQNVFKQTQTQRLCLCVCFLSVFALFTVCVCLFTVCVCFFTGNKKVLGCNSCIFPSYIAALPLPHLRWHSVFLFVCLRTFLSELDPVRMKTQQTQKHTLTQCVLYLFVDMFEIRRCNFFYLFICFVST